MAPTLYIFAIVLAILGVGIWLAETTEAQPIPCMGSETREKLREMMLAGIDKGFESHTIHIFDIWVKDSAGKSDRANAGMRNVIQAYIRSRNNALKWSPPLCNGPNP